VGAGVCLVSGNFRQDNTPASGAKQRIVLSRSTRTTRLRQEKNETHFEGVNDEAGARQSAGFHRFTTFNSSG